MEQQPGLVLAQSAAHAATPARENDRVRRRGIVWIAPADLVPTGCMADPVTCTFLVSWQHSSDGLLDDAEVVGAERAIVWGRDRAQVVRIRLGDIDDTYFSAGVRRVPSLPPWPPQPPAGGWWSPGDPRADPPIPVAPARIVVGRPNIVAGSSDES